MESKCILGDRNQQMQLLEVRSTAIDRNSSSVWREHRGCGRKGELRRESQQGFAGCVIKDCNLILRAA